MSLKEEVEKYFKSNFLNHKEIHKYLRFLYAKALEYNKANNIKTYSYPYKETITLSDGNKVYLSIDADIYDAWVNANLEGKEKEFICRIEGLPDGH